MTQFQRLSAIALIFLMGLESRAQALGLSGRDTAPPGLLQTAVAQMATLKGVDESVIVKSYKITWSYEGWYDDDQPADFFFANQIEACLVAVGIQSNTVRETHCFHGDQ